MSPGQMVLNGQQFGQLGDEPASRGGSKQGGAAKKEKDEKSKAVTSQTKKAKVRSFFRLILFFEGNFF